MDPITIIQKLYQLTKALYEQKQKVKANHEQFNLMTARVQVVVDMLRALKEVPKTEVFVRALLFLQNTLVTCQAFMEKYTRRSYLKRLFKAGADEKNFTKLTNEIEQANVQLGLGIAVQGLVDRRQDESARERDKATLLGEREALRKQLEQQAVEQKLSQAQQQKILVDRLASLKFHLEQKAPEGVPFNELNLQECLDEPLQYYRGTWRKQQVMLARVDLPPAEFTAKVTQMRRWISPQVLKVLEACYEPERQTLITEILPQAAAQLLMQSTPAQKQQMAQDVLKGLRYLHQEGYGFGSLLPSEIYVDKYGQAKLLPLAVVALHQPLNKPLSVFAAPELKLHPQVTPQADIYSYGVFLWMLFKGLPHNVEPLAMHLQGIPTDYAALITQCWQPPAARPTLADIEKSLTALSQIAIEIAPEDKAEVTPRALRHLGERYEQEKTFEKAFSCYQRAARGGDISAKTRVGFFYLTGQGVARNQQKARQLFLQASAKDLPGYPQGHPRAQYNLALMYLKGDGVAADKGMGYFWLNQSAEQGYDKAIQALAELKTAIAAEAPRPR